MGRAGVAGDLRGFRDVDQCIHQQEGQGDHEQVGGEGKDGGRPGEGEGILSEVVTELEELSNYNAELHKSCDFITKNFDLRQTARDEEVEALKQAKAILSGAKFSDFLQKE